MTVVLATFYILIVAAFTHLILVARKLGTKTVVLLFPITEPYMKAFLQTVSNERLSMPREKRFLITPSMLSTRRATSLLAFAVGLLCSMNAWAVSTCDVVVTKFVNNPNPQGGDLVVYTVTVSNRGPAATSFATVSDELPSTILYVTSSVTAGEYNTKNWNPGTLAPGTSHTLTLTGRATQPVELSTIINNPEPYYLNQFGSRVVGLGSNRIVIAADMDNVGSKLYVGRVFVYDTNGVRLCTITNPTPQSAENFGSDVAALGTNRIVVGCPQEYVGSIPVGAAYIYSDAGSLLLQITNPAPQRDDNFGASVAVLSPSVIAVGAPDDDVSGVTNVGAVYLFSTNGTLLNTITNLAPQTNGMTESFGAELAAWGNDWLLVGVPDEGLSQVGLVYLFHTNGSLLQTFTNPAPVGSDRFGSALVILDANHCAIGAPDANPAGISDAGIVYVFDSSGALSCIVSNPFPSIYEGFGRSLYSLSPALLLIGCDYDNTVGSVFMCRTNGEMIACVDNPLPASYDSFGCSVAMINSNIIAVGAENNDPAGTNEAGSVYLFDVNCGGYVAANVAYALPDQYWSDTNIANNVAQANVVVGRRSNLSVTKTPAQNRSVSGSIVEYQILVSNRGPDRATAVHVYDPLPHGLSFLSYSATRGTIDPDNGDWELPYLVPGGSETLWLTARADLGSDLLVLSDPSMGGYDRLGYSLAPFGTQYIAAGSVFGGVVLFDRNGSIVTNIVSTNALYCTSVCALDEDRLIVGNPGKEIFEGQPWYGSVILFNAAGREIITITNPSPNNYDYFGSRVCAVGTNVIAISAPGDLASGGVYLYNATGSLIRAMTNSPWNGYGRDFSFAPLGSDRLVIGAGTLGQTCICDTNGAILLTFTNQGQVAAVAVINDSAIVAGMPYADPGNIQDAGEVRVYNLGGQLLRVITNPAPAQLDYFGATLSPFDDDSVVVGVPADSPNYMTAAGRAYIMGLDGSLRGTIQHPYPATLDEVGYAVAGIGGGSAVVGVPFRSEGIKTEQGAVLLFRARSASRVITNALACWSQQADTNMNNNSAEAAVHVLSVIPRFMACTANGTNHLLMCEDLEPGYTAVVQRAYSMRSNEWTTVGLITAVVSATFWTNNVAPNASNVFYRVRYP